MTVDDLSHLTAAEIDTLPFGFIGLAPDGTVRKYNRYEADLARKDPREVLGKNFFRDVAPCTQVQEFQGRFETFARGEGEASTATFEFEFRFRHGPQKVRIAFLRSPLDREIIVTVTRVVDRRLAVFGELVPDPIRGRLEDGGGAPVLVAGAGFWTALAELHEGTPDDERRRQLHRLGWLWGSQEVLRVESWVQREQGSTLREAELQLALETLAGSAAAAGLGSFEVDLSHRDRGLLEIRHRHSPFVEWHRQQDGNHCGLLAGFHAGCLSYLSGRKLVGREIDCSVSPGAPCRFLVGTEERIERLFDPAPSSRDEELLAELGLREVLQHA